MRAKARTAVVIRFDAARQRHLAQRLAPRKRQVTGDAGALKSDIPEVAERAELGRDAFARPADAVAGKRRAAVQKGAAAHAKTRKRPGDPEPAASPPAKKQKKGKKSK